jgi:transposase
MEVPSFIPDDWREWRRLRALDLKQQGWYQRDIAAALGVSEEAVSRWLARARDGGPEALLSRPAPGRPPKLSPAQKGLIPEFLWHGPEAYGFRGEAWTRARVARVIREEFGVGYHKGHVGRLLADLGWTPQVPVTRAIQRDEGPSAAGATRPGRSCSGGRGASGGCWSWWTRRGSTCCRGWSGPTPPKG